MFNIYHFHHESFLGNFINVSKNFMIVGSWTEFINPQMPKVKSHLRTPKGRGGYHPPGFLPSRPNFLKIFLMGMFSRSRNPTVITKKFYLYCMTLKIKKSRSNTLLHDLSYLRL